MLFLLLLLAAFLLFMFPMVRCAVCHPFKLVYYGIQDGWKHFTHRSWNEAPYGQITCYIADSSTSFGCGKTLSATDFIVSLYRQYDGKLVWCRQRKKFVTQRVKVISNVDFLTIPYEKLTSLAQFVQWTDIVPDYDLEHDTLTGTYMLIDEASSQLNSRAFKENFDAVFIQNLLTARHVHASFFLTSHDAKRPITQTAIKRKRRPQARPSAAKLPRASSISDDKSGETAVLALCDARQNKQNTINKQARKNNQCKTNKQTRQTIKAQ